MNTTLMILVTLGWFGGVVVLMFAAMDIEQKRDVGERVVWGVAAALLFAVPLGYAIEAEASDPRLCLRGHQEYVRRGRMVGKVYTSTTEKVWVCEAWAERE